ncbi:hypothetical protein F5Y15DRAFT_420776 [Xylariaceae sp. FL0016]|nr:hypothetical protein F5Y15DRAFT_420776 [Xylariaceae sp. FL0016]
MDEDPDREIEINVSLLKRSIGVVEKLSSHLKCVILPTGTKAYGVHLMDHFPFRQDLALQETLPRIPEPYASQMFYYNQRKILFVPNNDVYCLAQALSTFLSLYAEINGEGSAVIFPGTEKSWKSLSNDSSSDIVAKVSIYASLHSEVTSEQR